MQDLLMRTEKAENVWGFLVGTRQIIFQDTTITKISQVALL